MVIITYNVNGIRAAINKGFLNWLEETNPDVVCLQETKAQPDQIPVLQFQQLGYHTYMLSAKKKGYSGVAILTKQQPDNVVYGMDMPLYDNEGRLLRADYGDMSIISVYHPSGSSGDERQAFKMQWLDDFQHYIHQLLKRERNNSFRRLQHLINPLTFATQYAMQLIVFLPEEENGLTVL